MTANLTISSERVLQAIKAENAANSALPKEQRKPLTSAKLERLLGIDHVAMNAHLAILVRRGLVNEDFGWQAAR